jgi:adrenodoxin-NADP+ reductase
LAYGASKDRQLGLEGETHIKGIHSARAFVGWYNGLPEYQNLALDLAAGEEAIVIGQGNVALDVARILLKDVDDLRKTDITEAALETLSKSRIKRVTVVGRRGPMQASFTVKEVRELMQLPGVSFDPIPAELLPAEISKLPRTQKRIMQVLQKGTIVPESSRSWALDFLLSPKALLSSHGHVTGIEFERSRLVGSLTDPSTRVEGTGSYTTLSGSLILRSIGYKSDTLQGLSTLGASFNLSRGIVSNINGRVCCEGEGEKPIRSPGVYASGWVKEGPTGVIASTMYTAFDTGDAIVGDWNSGERFLGDETEPQGWQGVRLIDDAPLNVSAVSWDAWHRIDARERGRGLELGKPREKFTSVESMLKAAEKV